MTSETEVLTQDQKIALIGVLEKGFSSSEHAIDGAWLSRIEHAQMTHPADPALQYLAGIACQHLQLWGKAQQLLKHALPRLTDRNLTSRAWQVMAELAQRQGDDAQAALAWKNATQASLRRPA
jgi:HemY protein